MATGQVKAGPTIGSQINPLISGGIEQITHQSLLSGARMPERKGGLIGGILQNAFEGTPPVQIVEHLIEGTPQPKPNKRTGEVKPFLSQKDMRHLIEGIVGVPVKNISPEATLRLADAEKGTKRHKRKRAKSMANSLRSQF